MKKIIIGLLALSSVSVFAQDSQFERGFVAGKKSCHEAKEAWICTVQNEQGPDYFPLVGKGSTRAEAILKIDEVQLHSTLAQGNKLNCVKL